MFQVKIGENGTYGLKIDSWAIGVIMYQLWQGKLPFVGDIEIKIIKEGMPRIEGLSDE